jgi:c-di-GMP-binding flagellar brake protein YcgR
MEQRGFERLILDGDAHVKTRGKTPIEYRAFLDNFSFGGFAMYSQEKLRPGRIVEFRIMTRMLDEALVGKAKVRHVTLPRKYNSALFTVGVEFKEVNKDLVTHILRRIQAKIAEDEIARKERKAYSLDFMAF